MVDIPLFTGFDTSWVVVWDFFHQQYVFFDEQKTCPFFGPLDVTLLDEPGKLGTYHQWTEGLFFWMENHGGGLDFYGGETHLDVRNHQQKPMFFQGFLGVYQQGHWKVAWDFFLAIGFFFWKESWNNSRMKKKKRLGALFKKITRHNVFSSQKVLKKDHLKTLEGPLVKRVVVRLSCWLESILFPVQYA